MTLSCMVPHRCGKNRKRNVPTFPPSCGIANFALQNERNGSLCPNHEPRCSESRSLSSQVHPSLIPVAQCFSLSGRGVASQGDFCALRFAEDNGVPSSVYTREMRDGG